jgi:hypothetical protein
VGSRALLVVEMGGGGNLCMLFYFIYNLHNNGQGGVKLLLYMLLYFIQPKPKTYLAA